KAADEAAERRTQQKAAEEAVQKQAQQKAAEEAANAQQATERISEAQRRLSAIGLLAGGTDGKLGPRTLEAIRAFQLSEGLPDNGQLTDVLLTRLRDAPPKPVARARALVSLATEAARAGRVSDAIRLNLASINLDSSDANAFLSLGDLYKTSGNLEPARQNW